MRGLSELRAMGLLVLRSWFRMGPRLRGGRKPEPTRGVSAVLMRLVFAALMYNFGFTSSLQVARQSHPSSAATWAGLAVGVFLMALPLTLELPSPRMPAQALKSDLLELLPISAASKLVLSLGQATLFLPISLGLSVSLYDDATVEAGLSSAILLGSLHFICFTLLGACLGKLLKRTLSPYRASRLSSLASVFSIGGLVLFQLSRGRWLSRPPPLIGDGLGRALLGTAVWRANAGLGLLILLLALAYTYLERGHELSEPVRPGSIRSAFHLGTDMRRLEQLLTRREPGGSFQVPVITAISAGVVGFLTWELHAGLPSARYFWNSAALIELQMISTLGMQRANRSVTRDMLARPLLGALPIAPRDTLKAKAATLRSTLLIVASPLLLLLGVGAWRPEWLPELGWRLVLSLLAVATYASAATYVAFLTMGLGSARPRGGALGSLESFLLAIPFASVLYAPGPGSALLSLSILAGLAFEARRAALQTIDWLDDAEREHSTEVWRALVVFGGFQGAQLLTQQLAAVLAGAVSPTMQMLGAYSVAAVALWAMTAREQEQAPTYRPKLAPLGLVVGALSSGFAWLYLRFLHATPGAVSTLHIGTTVEAVVAAVAIVGVAPIVEERFFRGWLQSALQRSLGERAAWAPLLTGLAFAAAHPAYSFLPVLVLGLLNGFLMRRFGSLSACVVAHAVHNAMALYFGAAT